MVVAIKRAVGSEYQYQETVSHTSTYGNRKKEIKKQISPSLKVATGVFLIAFLFCGALSYLGIKAGAAKMNYDIATMKKANQNILVSNEKLKLEIEKLKSLDRIEGLAVAQLGMIRSANIEYLVMSSTPNFAIEKNGAFVPAVNVADSKEDTSFQQNQAQVSSGVRFLHKIETLVFNKG